MPEGMKITQYEQLEKESDVSFSINIGLNK